MKRTIFLYFFIIAYSCNKINYRNIQISYRAISKTGDISNGYGNTYHRTTFLNDSIFIYTFGTWSGSDTLCKVTKYSWQCKGKINKNSNLYSLTFDDTFYIKSSDIYKYYEGQRILYLSYSKFKNNKPTCKVYRVDATNDLWVEILNPIYRFDSGLVGKVYVYEKNTYKVKNETKFLADVQKSIETKEELKRLKEEDSDTLYLIPGIGKYYYSYYKSPLEKNLAKMQDIEYGKDFYRFYKRKFKEWR